MKHVFAELITIGDEILYGQIVDTNSQWMSKELDKIGIKTVRKTTVADTEVDIITAFEEATTRADLILITGGLGPTNDDLTKPCLAKYFNCSMQMNSEALAEVTAIFERIGRELTEINKQQANLPTKCTMLSNRVGTAPGMWFKENGKVYVSMPGVPHEMKTMMQEQVLPKVQEVFDTPTIYHKLVKTIGLGESWLADKIKDWEANLPENIKLAYLPGLGEVKLRLTAVGSDLPTLKAAVSHQIELLKPLAGAYIYGYDKDTLAKVLGEMLVARNITIGCAESCTGGALASVLTSIPGSSQYFLGSIVAYHNKVKSDVLQVSNDTLESHGAVSEATVLEMALGAKKVLNSNIGVATSGIAGPTGGTIDKPVGTIWIALAYQDHTIAKKLTLFKDRGINVKYTAHAVLNLVRQTLLEMDGEKAIN